MSDIAKSYIGDWLQLKSLPETGLYKTVFKEHHLGNIFIRSLHGGVSGATIELAAEMLMQEQVAGEAPLMVSSSSVDYLRITKDADLYARAKIVRHSPRLSVVDVMCWQDNESAPVARGVVTIKIG